MVAKEIIAAAARLVDHPDMQLLLGHFRAEREKARDALESVAEETTTNVIRGKSRALREVVELFDTAKAALRKMEGRK
ncbi:MAG: hypothetical protein PWQ57_3320 [Desulfovibrionales bacterium]|jgi:hypothetical protein|nr:hypothetical protein [Desulfovibrionales bacterium]